MSASDSESSTASKEDNSDMYRREFDLEDEEPSVNVNAHGDDLGNGDFEYGQQPYANEPLADEAWLENYERETEQERRQFEEYTQTMQGEIPLDLW